MRKSFYILNLIFFILFSLLFRSTVFAQSEAPEEINEFCRPAVFVCPEIIKDDPENRLDSNLTLKFKNMPTGVDIYIFCGIQGQGEWNITSGNNKIDEMFCLGKNNATTLATTFEAANYLPYDLTVRNGNPLQTMDGNLNVNIESVSRTDTARNADAMHTCWGVYQTDVNRTGDEAARGNTLQLDDFKFMAAKQLCQTFRQDPYGRVFDAVSLKPLTNVDVTLLDQAQQKLLLPGVTNPIKTFEDGLFNFLVEPGTYFLTTPLANAQPHQNFNLAYTNLYTYGTPIIEKGAPEQRDIPVMYDDQTYAPKLTLMDYGLLQLGSDSRIQGKASWPLTKITLMQGANILAEDQANKYGIFAFDIDNDNIDAKMDIKVILTEVDLTQNPPVTAQNPSSFEKTLSPVPTYIDGYIYNDKGEVIGGAEVTVKLSKNDTPYYKTKANNDGLVIIAPANLPPLPFYLEISDKVNNKKIKLSVADFATQNKQYHSQNKIELIAGKKSDAAVDPVLTVKRPKTPGISVGGSQFGSNNQGNIANITPIPPVKNNQTILIIVLIAFFAFITIFILAGYFFLKQVKDQSLNKY